MAGDRNLDVRMRVRGQRAFNADTKKAEKGIKQLGSATGRAQLRARAGAKALGGLTGALRATGKAGLYAGGALVAGGGVLGKRSIEEWREAGKVNRVTAARIRSTGKAAGFSTKQIANLATDLSNLTAIDDEAVQSTANLLLTFTNVKGDVFKDAVLAATDMGAELGNARSAALQLGKALQDPEKGATALKRAGLDAHAVETAQALAAEGKQRQAQRYLLREVRKEFGGTAAAQADAIDKLKVSWANLEEGIGGVIGPPAMALADEFADHVVGLQKPLEQLSGRMAAIWDPKKNRSFAENFRRSRGLIRRELGPVWGDMRRDLERADLDGKLVTAVGNAIPIMSREAGEGGGRVAWAFLQGWWDADIGGKLFTAALIGGKLGLFAPLGRKAAGKFSGTFARSTAAQVAAQTTTSGWIGAGMVGGAAAQSRWSKLGRLAGRTFGVAAAAAIGVEIAKALRDDPKVGQYAGDWAGGDSGKAFGELGRDIADWLPGEDSEARRRRQKRERDAMNRRLRRDPGVRHGPRTRWQGPLRAPSPGRRPRAGPSRLQTRQLEGGFQLRAELPIELKLNDKVLATATGRVVADHRARK